MGPLSARDAVEQQVYQLNLGIGGRTALTCKPLELQVGIEPAQTALQAYAGALPFKHLAAALFPYHPPATSWEAFQRQYRPGKKGTVIAVKSCVRRPPTCLTDGTLSVVLMSRRAALQGSWAAKHNLTRLVIQVATPVPKKSASSVHTAQPSTSAQAKACQSSGSRSAMRASASRCRSP